MKRLLIAERSEAATQKFVEMLQDQWEIQTCHDGETAICMLRKSCPDAMILNLGLPKRSGFDILAECFPELPPVIVALTTVTTPFVAQQAARWGVDYLFHIPFDFDLVSACLGSVTALQSISAKRTAQHLRTLGVTASYYGYFCLLLAIPIYRDDFTQHLHKEVYAKVAASLQSDPRSVEHTIRTAIRAAWRHRSPTVWSMYFPEDNNGDLPCPQNKEFISIIAHRI